MSDVLLGYSILGLFLLIVIGGPVGIGVLLGRVRFPFAMVVSLAAVLSILLLAVIVGNRLAFERGGDIYTSTRGRFDMAIPLVGLAFLIAFGHAIGNVGFHRRTLGWRVLPPVAVYCASVLIVGGPWDVLKVPSTRGDATMIENFRAHEADFDRLREMLVEDKTLNQVCRPVVRHLTSLSPERIAEYETLLDAAGVRHGITREPRGPVLFRYWVVVSAGYADQSVEKGYAYLDAAPVGLRDSLDVGGLGGGLSYRHIDGPWHLYYYNRDSLKSSCDYFY